MKTKNCIICALEFTDRTRNGNAKACSIPCRKKLAVNVTMAWIAAHPERYAANRARMKERREAEKENQS